MQEAFDAIHDEAVRLLGLAENAATRREIEKGLTLIVSLARYQFDVRTEQERRAVSESE